MRRHLFTLPWGRAYHSAKLQEPVFRGNPQTYADNLLARYGNWGACLGFIDSLKNGPPDRFMTETRNYILNRIAGKKRSERPKAVPVTA